ncbi:Transcriptional regulatory protein mucR [Acetobacteraceae bacterium EV16G]|uniref:Transcriptional regulatory protein mucR n=1 Tax=Sorlinia euscelidii TaxID=3081148 RepID=A0ABU7U045_9PROT
MKSPASDVSLHALTAQIISSYVSNNEIETDDLMALIKSVHLAMMALARKENDEAKPVPAVHPKKSVFPDYIICLEDGKKLKLLRRHLHTVYKMTPQQYRERWDLPPEYPMVAPNYANHRSQLARRIGLGHRR